EESVTDSPRRSARDSWSGSSGGSATARACTARRSPAARLRDTRVSRRTLASSGHPGVLKRILFRTVCRSKKPPVFRTPGGPEEAAPYKGTARAHSKTADVDTTTAEADDSRRGGVVVALFDEIEKPSLRSHTAELRSAARAGAREADAFDEFWAAYPRRVGKGAARKAWAKATKKAAPEEIIAGARRYAAD